jgi:chemotaxis family two-component system response regulator Rcp1
MNDVTILVVDDNPVDVRLIVEALKQTNRHNSIIVLQDGDETIKFMHKEGAYVNAPVPDVILLDLNIPKKSGLEVLKEIKSDPLINYIPIVILTTSDAERDIAQSYELKANCYITKPFDIEDFFDTIKTIEKFWFDKVKYPAQENNKID